MYVCFVSDVLQGFLSRSEDKKDVFELKRTLFDDSSDEGEEEDEYVEVDCVRHFSLFVRFSPPHSLCNCV